MTIELIEISVTPVALPIPINREVEEVIAQARTLYQIHGFHRPWIGYLACVGNVCVGSCAFKYPPKDRKVEIAYQTFSQHCGKGFATQMVCRLIEISKAPNPELRITAKTLPILNASTAVLKKWQKLIPTIRSSLTRIA